MTRQVTRTMTNDNDRPLYNCLCCATTQASMMCLASQGNLCFGGFLPISLSQGGLPLAGTIATEHLTAVLPLGRRSKKTKAKTHTLPHDSRMHVTLACSHFTSSDSLMVQTHASICTLPSAPNGWEIGAFVGGLPDSCQWNNCCGCTTEAHTQFYHNAAID